MRCATPGFVDKPLRGRRNDRRHSSVTTSHLEAGYEYPIKQAFSPGDLKQRGLLDDTLVVWGGEFGRTSYCQGKLTASSFGRDHHPKCFSMWMAGGGVKPGFVFGETDEFGYNVVENGVHVHDLQATLLHLLGIDHERLTYKHQGRRYRLTDVHGSFISNIIA